MFNKEFVEEIIAGVKEVFSTMIMLDVVCQENADDRNVKISPDMSSMIGLGGDISGMLCFHCTGEFAKYVTGAFLGMEVAKIDEDVKDAVGEITNMIAGNFKISFGAREKNITIAIPTTVVGTSLKISGLGVAAGVVLPFDSEGGSFWVEIKCKDN